MIDFDKHWNYNEPADTEKKFREILDDLDATEHPGPVLELKTQIARTLGLQQKFDAAHKLLDEVEQALSQDHPVAEIRYLLERGRALNSSGKKDESLPLFIDAWEKGLKVKADFHAVDAAHMVAIVVPPEEQLAWNEKAMTLAEKSEDDRTKGWLGSLYNNIGWTYHDLGQYDQALDVFEKGFAFRQANKQLQEMHIAKWCIARTQRSLGNIELALRLQKDLKEEIREAGLPEDGYVFEELVECLLLLDRPAEAAPHAAKAHELLSKDPWMAKNEVARLERLEKLGSTRTAD